MQKEEIVIYSELDILQFFTTDDKMIAFLAYLFEQATNFQSLRNDHYFPVTYFNFQGKALVFEIDFVGVQILKYLQSNYKFDEQSMAIMANVFIPQRKRVRDLVKRTLFVTFFSDHYMITSRNYTTSKMPKSYYWRYLLRYQDRYAEMNGIPFSEQHLIRFLLAAQGKKGSKVLQLFRELKQQGKEVEQIAFGPSKVQDFWDEHPDLLEYKGYSFNGL